MVDSGRGAAESRSVATTCSRQLVLCVKVGGNLGQQRLQSFQTLGAAHASLRRVKLKRKFRLVPRHRCGHGVRGSTVLQHRGAEGRAPDLNQRTTADLRLARDQFPIDVSAIARLVVRHEPAPIFTPDVRMVARNLGIIQVQRALGAADRHGLAVR